MHSTFFNAPIVLYTYFRRIFGMLNLQINIIFFIQRNEKIMFFYKFFPLRNYFYISCTNGWWRRTHNFFYHSTDTLPVSELLSENNTLIFIIIGVAISVYNNTDIRQQMSLLNNTVFNPRYTVFYGISQLHFETFKGRNVWTCKQKANCFKNETI